MNKKISIRKNVSVFFAVIFLLLLHPKLIFAQFDEIPFEQCGTWNNDRNVPPERLCVVVGTHDQFINPYTACPDNQNACCPSDDIPPECGVSDPDDEPDPEEPEPVEEPGIYEESDEDCGTWFTDAGAGGTICLDWDNKIILNADDCSARTGMCCRATACPECWMMSQNQASCVACTDFPEGQTFIDEETCWEALPANNPPSDSGGSNSDPYDICVANLNPGSDAFSSCTSCDGIWTAIGCISDDPRSMTERFITIGTGIVGGVFLLRVLAAAFMLTTSQGDVKKTSEAKEMISEAVVGVIVVLMSVTIIQFVGSDILRIPGFGG